MDEPSDSRLDLERALQRFPDEAPAIRRMFLSDPDFRSVCEDYRLAGDTLAGFQRRGGAGPRAAIDDYHRVVAELEHEIVGYLRARQGMA
jgi:hypothetical protein